MQIERLTSSDVARLRALRLRALETSPEAFGTTAAEAHAWTDDAWRTQLERLATFVAVLDGEDVGLVRSEGDDGPPDDASSEGARPDAAWLISMWVAPQARRHGVGGALVDAVIAWARAEGHGRVLLDVTDDNVPAIALYARKGFEPTGRTNTLPPPRDHVTEHERELRLAVPGA